MDLIIVSAFGRGNWLANELSAKGWQTTLVDVSEALGSFHPAEIEGPFGLFQTQDLFPSQIIKDVESFELDHGFTLWLKEGPVEFRSPLTELQLRHNGVGQAVAAYVGRSHLPSRESEKDRRSLTGRTFTESWLAHFSHQITSSCLHENFEALRFGKHAPLFAPMSLRQASRAGLNRQLETCAGRVVRHAKVQRILFSSKSVTAIDLEEAGAPLQLTSRVYLWMLSSEEAKAFPHEVSDALYPRGSLRPEWYWQRLGFKITDWSIEDIPVFTVILEDIYLPWTHSNMMVLRRNSQTGTKTLKGRTSDQTVDVWLKLPIFFQAKADRLSAFADEAKAILEKKLPGAKLEPLTPHHLKQVNHPIFAERTRGNFAPRMLNNLFYCGPEQWESVDQLGSYRAQNATLKKLSKLKTAWDLAEAKAALKRARRAQSEVNKND